MGKIAEARSALEDATQLFPDYAEAWCSLGLLQTDQEQTAAMHSFREAIRSDPRAVCPYMPLAKLEYDARDWPALVEVTDRLLRLNAADHPLAFLLNAAGHYNLARLDEAERSARDAEALDALDAYPQIRELLGWIALRKDNYAEAVSQFDQYMKSPPAEGASPEVRSALDHLTELHRDIRREAAPGPVFSVDTALALLQFQTTPKGGELAKRLRPEDIEIREDGVPQKTQLFEAGRSYRSGVPVEISLLFDCSASLVAPGTLNPYVFHENILDEYENVSIAIYGFSDNLLRLTKPTRDARALKEAMEATPLAKGSGDTRLFGSILDMIQDGAEGRSGVIRMAVVFSDGISDTELQNDKSASGAAAAAARKLGTAIYPVVLSNSYYSHASPAFAMEQIFPSIGAFARLANQTGGRVFGGIQSDMALPVVLRRLAKEVLAYTHVAGYYADISEKPRSHEAEVVLLNPAAGRLDGGRRVVMH